MSRSASVIVCDEILFNLAGKVHLQGVYTTEIGIPGSELQITQLCFYFSVETPAEKPFKQITVEVTFPGSPPILNRIPVAEPVARFDRPKMTMKGPIVVQQPILRAGKIETKVITESETLDAGGFFISKLVMPS